MSPKFLRTAGRFLSLFARSQAAPAAPRRFAGRLQTRQLAAGQRWLAPMTVRTNASTENPSLWNPTNAEYAPGVAQSGRVESWLEEHKRVRRSDVVKDIDLAIRDDHDEIFATYSKYSVAQEPREKRHLLAELVRRIAVHSAAEDAVVSPKFLGLEDHTGLHTERGDVRERLTALERPGLTQAGFDQELWGLIMDLKAHVAAQETITLPALRWSLMNGEEGVETMRELSAAYREATNAFTKAQAQQLLKVDTTTQLEAGAITRVYDAVRSAVASAEDVVVEF